MIDGNHLSLANMVANANPCLKKDIPKLGSVLPKGVKNVFIIQNSTPGGVGEPLPRTLSQIKVSRDQNFINFCCKMSICANGLLNSCNSGINIGAHSLRSHQLADHFPMPLPIEADLDPFKT